MTNYYRIAIKVLIFNFILKVELNNVLCLKINFEDKNPWKQHMIKYDISHNHVDHYWTQREKHIYLNTPVGTYVSLGNMRDDSGVCNLVEEFNIQNKMVVGACPNWGKYIVFTDEKGNINKSRSWKNRIKCCFGNDLPISQSGFLMYDFNWTNGCPAGEENEKEDYWNDILSDNEFDYSLCSEFLTLSNPLTGPYFGSNMIPNKKPKNAFECSLLSRCINKCYPNSPGYPCFRSLPAIYDSENNDCSLLGWHMQQRDKYCGENTGFGGKYLLSCFKPYKDAANSKSAYVSAFVRPDWKEKCPDKPVKNAIFGKWNNCKTVQYKHCIGECELITKSTKTFNVNSVEKCGQILFEMSPSDQPGAEGSKNPAYYWANFLPSKKCIVISTTPDCFKKYNNAFSLTALGGIDALDSTDPPKICLENSIEDVHECSLLKNIAEKTCNEGCCGSHIKSEDKCCGNQIIRKCIQNEWKYVYEPCATKCTVVPNVCKDGDIRNEKPCNRLPSDQVCSDKKCCGDGIHFTNKCCGIKDAEICNDNQWKKTTIPCSTSCSTVNVCENGSTVRGVCNVLPIDKICSKEKCCGNGKNSVDKCCGKITNEVCTGNVWNKVTEECEANCSVVPKPVVSCMNSISTTQLKWCQNIIISNSRYFLDELGHCKLVKNSELISYDCMEKCCQATKRCFNFKDEDTECFNKFMTEMNAECCIIQSKFPTEVLIAGGFLFLIVAAAIGGGIYYLRKTPKELNSFIKKSSITYLGDDLPISESDMFVPVDAEYGWITNDQNDGSTAVMISGEFSDSFNYKKK